MRYIGYILSLLIMALVTECAVEKDCIFTKHHETSQVKGNAEISNLKGHRYSVSDGLFKYDIGICTAAGDAKELKLNNIGVIQTEKNNTSNVKKIGKYDDADIIAGTGWVILTYNGGDPYGSHCMGAEGKANGEKRRAKIMFICDKTSNDIGAIQPNIIEEQNDKDAGCYYLFEINTSEVCVKEPLITLGLSTGTILLIVFFSVASFYLLAGVLYKRFVLHAKGVEQIPNVSFWTDFGNLQADGCDLICRSRKSRQPREYKGIGDEQLGDTDLSPDDGLLPM